MAGVRVPIYGTPAKQVTIDPNATKGATLGVDLYYQGRLLDPSEVLNVYASVGTNTTTVIRSGSTGSNPSNPIPAGDLTTDLVTEGTSNQYFTAERAMDAVGFALANTPTIAFTYNDAGNTITANDVLLTTKGDLYTFSTVPFRLAVGTDGKILYADSSQTAGLRWGTPPTGVSVTTKGDLQGYDTSPNRIPVGTNGYVLTADSTSALGLKWAAASGSGALTAAAYNYTYQTASIATGNVQLSGGANQQASTLLTVHFTDSDSVARTVFYDLVRAASAGSYIRIALASNPLVYAQFKAQSPAIAGSTYGFVLSGGAASSINPFSNSDPLIVSFLPIGNASPLSTKGDLWTFDSANTRLGVGTNGWVLTADSAASTGLKWAAPGTPTLPLTTKGDIQGYDSAPARIPVGANGQVLTADSTATPGVKWATPTNLSNWFNVKDPTYGAVGNGSTDDTVAIQAAITACASAGGGTVYFPAGIYVIGGALQNTGTSNCQLVLPSVNLTTATPLTIRLLGCAPPSTSVSVGVAVTLPTTGSILKGTLTSGTGQLLGGCGPSSGFTNINVKIENLGFRLVSNPTNTAIDLSHVAGCELNNVAVDCGNYYSLGNTYPTTSTSYGIRTPANNNGAFTLLNAVTVIGFYNGIEINEHTDGDALGVWACVNAYVVPAGYHASYIKRSLVVHCSYGIKVTGVQYVDFAQYDFEYVTSGSFARVYDIDDASNNGAGFVRWHGVQSSVGITHSFVVNSATGFQTSEVGTAIGGGGGSYYYRADDLTATGGETGITLAAAVYNKDIQLVRRASGVSKFVLLSEFSQPTTSSVTLSSAMAASEIISVMYRTLTASPGASTLVAGSFGLDPAHVGTGGTLSNSNRTLVNNGTNGAVSARSINSHSSGKWYAEVVVDLATSSPFCTVGLVNSSASMTILVGQDANGWAYYEQTGEKYTNNTTSAFGTSWTTGDVLGILWDATGGNLYFAKNNTLQNGGTAAFTGLSGAMFVGISPYRATAPAAQLTVNLKAADQTYSLPSGYSSWD